MKYCLYVSEFAKKICLSICDYLFIIDEDKTAYYYKIQHTFDVTVHHFKLQIQLLVDANT